MQFVLKVICFLVSLISSDINGVNKFTKKINVEVFGRNNKFDAF